MTDETSFGIATWRLPDPRTHGSENENATEVFATRRRWAHIIQAHLTKASEPWSQWFPAAMIKILLAQRPKSQHSPQYKAALQDASRLMGNAIRACLESPFALLYERRRTSGPEVQRQNVWELLLEVGVVAIIHERGGRNVLWTAYFPYWVTPSMDEHARFREALRYQVKKFTDRRKRPGQSTDYVATPGPIQKRTPQQEICRSLQWVTLKSWGFRQEPAGVVWRMANVRLPESLSVSDVAQRATIKLQKGHPAGAATRGN